MGDKLLITGDEAPKYIDPAKKGFTSLLLKIPDSLSLLAVDDLGNYWAVNKKKYRSRQGIFIYNGTAFQPVQFDSSIFARGFLRSFHIGRKGDIWIAPAFEGVEHYKLDNQTKKISFVKRYLPNGVDVYDIVEGKDGNVWVGTYNNGLVKIDTRTNKVKEFTVDEGAPSNFIFKLVQVQQSIWLISDLGTAFFDLRTDSFRMSKELDDFTMLKAEGNSSRSNYDIGIGPSAIVTRSGEIALIVKNGFCLFDPKELLPDTVRPILQLTEINISGKPGEITNLKAGQLLEFSYNENSLGIGYIGLHYDQPQNNKYSYLLKGGQYGMGAGGHRKDRTVLQSCSRKI